MAAVSSLYVNYLNLLFPLSEQGASDAPLHSAILKDDAVLFEKMLNPEEQDPAKRMEIVKRRVNQIGSKLRLTPLHLCAIRGLVDRARHLVELGADPNCQDARGWTPMHHAAVRNDREFFQFLFQANADIQIKNLRGATAPSILSLAHKLPNPDDQICHYQDKDGKIIQGTGRDFTSLTGAKYFADREMYVPPKQFVKDWFKNPQAGNSFLRSENYEDFRKAVPIKVFLRKTERAGWEVCAGQFIPKGTVVMEYFGKTIDSETTNLPSEDYRYEDFIDAHDHRSYGSMANDSFPSVRAVDIYNCRGLHRRVIFQAIRDIAEGESIAWDYGLGYNSLKLGVHSESCPNQMDEYFRKICGEGQSLLAQFVDYKKRNTGKALSEISLEDQQFLESIYYIISTPAALCSLVCKKIIPFSFIQECLASEEFKLYDPFPMMKMALQPFLKILGMFAAKMDNLDQAKIEKVLKATETANPRGLMELMVQLSS